MKKTLGYGYKLSSESMSEALKMYYYTSSANGFHKSKKAVEKQIKRDKEYGIILQNSRPKVFKVVVETV